MNKFTFYATGFLLETALHVNVRAVRVLATQKVQSHTSHNCIINWDMSMLKDSKEVSGCCVGFAAICPMLSVLYIMQFSFLIY